MKAAWISVVLLTAAATFVAGSWRSTHTSLSRKRTAGESVILYYRDPMHPAYTSAEPGIAPDCGMRLEPVHADQAAPAPNLIQVTPEKQKAMGIVLGRVEKGRVTKTLRTVGRVALDESRTFPVNAGADGVVRNVFAGSTYAAVRKGQPLAAIYGREYVTVQRTFLYALRALEVAPSTAGLGYENQPAFSVEEASRNLLDMGFGEEQLKQMKRDRQPVLDVVLVAPATGIIISRNIFPQQRFTRGTELFRIVDLNRVWIDADVSAEDAAYASTAAVIVCLPGQPASALHAVVSDSQPRFDPNSRTLKIRFQADNLAGILRPGMFVDVSFSAVLPEAVTVPASAVMDFGDTSIVFLEQENSSFETRIVETGWRAGGRVQILGGLEPGASIVTSGHFLLDSEARIRATSVQHDQPYR